MAVARRGHSRRRRRRGADVLPRRIRPTRGHGEWAAVDSLVGQLSVASGPGPGLRPARGDPSHAADRQDGFHRGTPDRRRSGHGHTGRSGYVVDSLPRGRQHRGMVPGARLARYRAGECAGRLLPDADARGSRRIRDRSGRSPVFGQGRSGAVPGGESAPSDGLPRARACRCLGGSSGPLRNQSGPDRRPGYAAGAGSQPDRRHARRHQVIRCRVAGPIGPSGRRLEGSRDLRCPGIAERPPVSTRRRRRGSLACFPPGAGPRP